MLDDHTGKVLGGRYLVKALVGRGGMGSVYEGVQIDLARPVALKILDPMLDPRRLRDEALAAASLVHPAIVRVTDFHAADGDDPPFLVMELLRGRSLAAWLRERGPLPLPVAVRVALQMLSALGAAHEARILHRDVKPGNVFLLDPLDPEAPTIKLLDFGLAKMLADEHRRATTTGAVLGTLGYMAPEQVRGDPVGPPADLYATGVCLYEMACGGRPFDDLVAVLEGSPPDPTPRVGPAVARVILTAVAKEPARRYASASEMSAALREATATPPPAPRRLEPTHRRFVPFVAATVATVTLGAAGGYVALFRAGAGRHPKPPASTPAVPVPEATPEPRPTVSAEPTSRSETTAPVATATLAPSKQMCVCRTADRAARPLCQTLEPTCECRDAEGFVVCETRFSEHCTYRVPKTAKTGDACSGYLRSWYQDRRVDPPAQGTLRCSRGCPEASARAQRQSAIPGTPCRGLRDEEAPPLTGIWVPSGP